MNHPYVGKILRNRYAPDTHVVVLKRADKQVPSEVVLVGSRYEALMFRVTDDGYVYESAGFGTTLLTRSTLQSAFFEIAADEERELRAKLALEGLYPR